MDRNTVSHDISPMSLLWLLLAGGSVSMVLLFCFGNVPSVTRRVSENLKASRSAIPEIQTAIQPATNPLDNLAEVQIKLQAQKEAFEKVCRDNEAEVLPEGRYPLGVYTVRGGGEGEYFTYTTIPIPTGNICTFPSGKAEKAVDLAQWYKTKPVQPWKAGV